MEYKEIISLKNEDIILAITKHLQSEGYEIIETVNDYKFPRVDYEVLKIENK